MKSRLGMPALILVGTLLLQAAWILAVPPFRGSDEFDHAYRAVAVARGEWRAHGYTPEGRGGLVTVTPDIVTAAHDQCAALKYTRRDNCTAAMTLPNGRVRVASGASSYNPAYYWVIGTFARPFHGTNALYAMRALSALLCALAIAGAAYCAGLRRRSGFRVFGILVAITPVAVYSTAIAAPNGPEIAAGLLLWTALLAIDAEDPTAQRTVFSLATVAAVALVSLRALGPLWALLILACVMLARAPDIRRIWTVHRSKLVTGFAITTVATVAAVAWTWSVRGTSPDLATGASAEVGATNADVFRLIPVGILQAIAAFPLRDEMAPLIVYPCFAVVGLALLVLGWRSASGNQRRGLAAVVALSVVVPLAVSLPTIQTDGLIWQGRYGLPLSVGIFLLAGWSLSSTRPAWAAPGAVVALVLLGVAHLTSVVGVAIHEHGSAAAIHDPGWVLALGIAGFATCAYAVKMAA